MMDRFDEMRTKGINTNDATATSSDILEGKTAYSQGKKVTGTLVPSGGGGNGLNVKVQTSKPSSANGLWIKESGSSGTTYLNAYYSANANFISESMYDFLSPTNTIYAQVFVGEWLYHFGVDSANSYKINIRTQEKISISFDTLTSAYTSSCVGIFNPKDNSIYIFYTYNKSSNDYYYVYLIKFDVLTDTYTKTQIYSGRSNYNSYSTAYIEGDMIYLGNNTYNMTTGAYATNIPHFGVIYGNGENGFMYGTNAVQNSKGKSLQKFDVSTRTTTILISDCTPSTGTYHVGATFTKGDTIYVFYASTTDAVDFYGKYSLSSGTIEYISCVSYNIATTDNNGRSHSVFCDVEGILFLRYGGKELRAFQIEGGVESENMQTGDVLVIQDGAYKNPVKILESPSIQIGVYDTFIKKGGILSRNHIAYWGDGEEWHLIKNPNNETATVTFDTNGGTSVEVQEVVIGTAVAQPTTTKDGYNFIEWTLNGEPYDFSTPVISNITLVAQWKEIEEVEVTFVDYIEGTGTQYIDTGYKPSGNKTRVVCEASDFPATKTGWLFGSRNPTTPREAFGFVCIDSNQYRSDYASDNIAIDAQYNFTEKFVIDKDKNKTYLNETLVHTAALSSFASNYNMYIFTINQGDSPELYNGVTKRIHSFKIYDNDILVRDFKPCKDLEGVYCFYETISGEFFYNAGTGEFRGEGWKPSYIESTGTQYIDTGFKPNNNTSVEMKALIPSSQDGKLVRFFEARNSISGVEGAFGILTFDDNNKLLQLRYNSTANLSNGQLAEETEYVIRTDKNKMYVNGELKITQTASTFQTNYNLYLFGFHIPTELSSNQGIYRLFYFKLYDGDTLIRDYIPALDNGVACLYDKVSGVYFHNAGTGTFTAG